MQVSVVTPTLMMIRILGGGLADDLLVKLFEHGVVLRVLVIDQLFQAIRHLVLIGTIRLSPPAKTALLTT